MVFSILGGDKRQIYLAEQLQKDGQKVIIYANNAIPLTSISLADSLHDAINSANVILLPFPCSKDEKTLNTPFFEKKIELQNLLNICAPNQYILGGKIPASFIQFAAKKGVVVEDYAQEESLQILNAIPTAEEAIKIAIENTDTTLFSSNILITGFGRIGKILARYLKALGAKVTVSARKESDIAWIEAEGFSSIYTQNIQTVLPKIDIVFNTIPHIILDKEKLQSCKKQALLIDLASGGGIDFVVADQLQLKNIHALSLPGKTAPKTSAYILFKTITKIIKEHQFNEERSGI